MKREGSSIDLFVVLCEEERVRERLNDAFHNDREAESGRLSDFITAPKVKVVAVFWQQEQQQQQHWFMTTPLLAGSTM